LYSGTPFLASRLNRTELPLDPLMQALRPFHCTNVIVQQKNSTILPSCQVSFFECSGKGAAAVNPAAPTYQSFLTARHQAWPMPAGSWRCHIGSEGSHAYPARLGLYEATACRMAFHTAPSWLSGWPGFLRHGCSPSRHRLDAEFHLLDPRTLFYDSST
jgi:hypothetical protein